MRTEHLCARITVIIHAISAHLRMRACIVRPIACINMLISMRALPKCNKLANGPRDLDKRYCERMSDNRNDNGDDDHDLPARANMFPNTMRCVCVCVCVRAYMYECMCGKLNKQHTKQHAQFCFWRGKPVYTRRTQPQRHSDTHTHSHALYELHKAVIAHAIHRTACWCSCVRVYVCACVCLVCRCRCVRGIEELRLAKSA